MRTRRTRQRARLRRYCRGGRAGPVLGRGAGRCSPGADGGVSRRSPAAATRTAARSTAGPGPAPRQRGPEGGQERAGRGSRAGAAAAAMSVQEDPVQREIHQDWANREYIEVITSSIKKIADFLNSFGEGAGRGLRAGRAGPGRAARSVSLPPSRRHVVPVPTGHPERETDGAGAED